MPYRDKEKERRNKKKYYRKNKERILQNKKGYYQKNKGKILQNKKEHYKKNKERIKKRMQLYGRKWYQKNKKKIQLLHRKYYQKNKKEVLQYHKKWYRNNKERLLLQGKNYYQKNRKKIQQRHRSYNRENIKKVLQYKRNWQKYKRKTDPKYRLDENMGTLIWASLKKEKAGKHWETLVDYTLADLTKHLEKQFDNKMNWDNYGSYWVIDHVRPKSLFNYTSPNDLKFKQCWALKNLQPLEKIENIKKSNRLS